MHPRLPLAAALCCLIATVPAWQGPGRRGDAGVRIGIMTWGSPLQQLTSLQVTSDHSTRQQKIDDDGKLDKRACARHSAHVHSL
jgi:hypothetical protein